MQTSLSQSSLSYVFSCFLSFHSHTNFISLSRSFILLLGDFYTSLGILSFAWENLETPGRIYLPLGVSFTTWENLEIPSRFSVMLSA